MKDVFDLYAGYYDLLYKDKDYGAESDYAAKLIKEYAPNAETILELGCGTAAHAEHLAKMGFTIHGIDISKTMLEKAQIRKSNLSAEAASRLTFEYGDIRTHRVMDEKQIRRINQSPAHSDTVKKFDVVLSLFHVFSYQTTNEDLEAAFRTAAAHLKPDGILIFDFWYGPAVLTQRPETRVKRLEDDKIKVTRIAEPVMHVNDNVVDVNYTVFIEENVLGKVIKLHEVHKMRYLFIPEIQLITKYLFNIKKIAGWMKTEEPNISDWGAVGVMRSNI